MKMIIFIFFASIFNPILTYAQNCAQNWEIPQFIWNGGIEAVCDRGLQKNPKVFFSEKQIFDPTLYEHIQNGDIVWVPFRFLEQFATEILPNATNSFVLLISDASSGDESFPLDCPLSFNVEKLIENPFIIHIFTQNCEYRGSSSKVSHFPIGIDFHTIVYQEKMSSPRELEITLVKIIASSKPTNLRNKSIFVDFFFSNTEQVNNNYSSQFEENKKSIFQKLLSTGLIEHEGWIKQPDLWKKKADYAFSISLHDTKLDCHRTWEDLALGCIVIVKSSPLDPLYEGLPVVIVNDWSEITSENLDRWLKFYGDALHNPDYREKLTHKYWYKKLLQPVMKYRTEKESRIIETYSLTDIHGVPLDHKLIKRINMKNGVFIEVGAYDGITQSNTALLEKSFGWTGILIEPSKSLYRELCIHRPYAKNFQCALGSFSENDTYILGDFVDLMSSVGGKRLNRFPTACVLIRSLQSILDEAGLDHIHFFSLDTEGYEYNILCGIDFKKVKFDYILIEIYTHEYDNICELLNQNGYEMIEVLSLYDNTLPNWDGTHNDYLFKRKDLPAIPAEAQISTSQLDTQASVVDFIQNLDPNASSSDQEISNPNL